MARAGCFRSLTTMVLFLTLISITTVCYIITTEPYGKASYVDARINNTDLSYLYSKYHLTYDPSVISSHPTTSTAQQINSNSTLYVTSEVASKVLLTTDTPRVFHEDNVKPKPLSTSRSRYRTITTTQRVRKVPSSTTKKTSMSVKHPTVPKKLYTPTKPKKPHHETTPRLPPAKLDQEILRQTMRYHYVKTTNRKYPIITAKHQNNTDKPLPVHQLWTYVTHSTLVYRIAHFDGRNPAYGGPVLIALALFDSRISHKFPKLNAKVVYSDEREVFISSRGTFYTLRRPMNDEFVHSHIVVFNLNKNESEIPYAAFICMTEDCTRHTAYLTVYWEDPPTEKLNFSVCLHQAIFEESDDKKVAAWFEMNRALGAQLITVYYQEFHPKVVSIVQKYVDEGLVQVYDWYNNFTVEADNNFGQAILIIDCFYRNLWKAEHVAFSDVDEILMPRSSPTWYGMWEELSNIYNDKAGGYKFCHAAFHDVQKVVPSTANEPSSPMSELRACANFTTLPIYFRRTNRSARVNCRFKRHKNFVKPMRIKKMTIHNFSPIKGYLIDNAPMRLGLLHHYRDHDNLRSEPKVEDLIVKDHFEPVVNGLLKKFC